MTDEPEARAAEVSVGRHSLSLAILALLAVVYTLYFGRAFFIPIFFAFELNFLLSPAIRWARRVLRLPAALTAGLLIIALAGGLGLGVYELAAPAQGWLTSAPATLKQAGDKLHKIMKPMEQVSRTAEQMDKVASVSGNGTPTRTVVVAGPSLGSRFFGTTQSIIGALLEVLVLLFFLLAAGDLFLQKTIKVATGAASQRTAIEVARQIEASISRYLVTSALLNLAEGAVFTGIMYLLKMPNPFLWGALVTCLEFIPYIGALTLVAILTIASLTVFDNVAHALIVPGSFVALNLIQGNLIGPTVMGHRLSLNPVAIFIGVAFWWEIWGIAGAFIAVPMLASLKIVCDHVEWLSGVGEFLGQRDADERRIAVRPATT
ncbi:MAG TPA: AI-2E family transporter [Gemmatimonadaceae bacterium]|nr:AI-2E family transporter [Gemmatimonadaceae bacterium]